MQRGYRAIRPSRDCRDVRARAPRRATRGAATQTDRAPCGVDQRRMCGARVRGDESLGGGVSFSVTGVSGKKKVQYTNHGGLGRIR